MKFLAQRHKEGWVWWFSPRRPTPKVEARARHEFEAGEQGTVWGREGAAAKTLQEPVGLGQNREKVVFKRGNLGGNCDSFKQKQSPGHQGHTGNRVCYLVIHLQTSLLWVRLCVMGFSEPHFSLYPLNLGSNYRFSLGWRLGHTQKLVEGCSA